MLQKNQILVIDDFINLEYQEKIKDNLMGDNSFPWYYIDDVTAAYEDDNQGRPGLSHVYIEYNDDGTSDIVSDFHDLFIPMLELACETLEMLKKHNLNYGLNEKEIDGHSIRIYSDNEENSYLDVMIHDGNTRTIILRLEHDIHTSMRKGGKSVFSFEKTIKKPSISFWDASGYFFNTDWR